MKLASFRYRDRDRIGFSVDGFLVDLADVAKAIGVPPLPADMIALIESGEQFGSHRRHRSVRDRVASPGAASVEDSRYRAQ
jgi:hypothetical protein